MNYSHDRVRRFRHLQPEILALLLCVHHSLARHGCSERLSCGPDFAIDDVIILDLDRGDDFVSQMFPEIVHYTCNLSNLFGWSVFI